MVEASAVVIGGYLGWVILAVYPRGLVRLSWNVLLDILTLLVTSALLSLVCVPVLRVLIMTILAVHLYHNLPSPWINPRGKAVLITGCDTGIGHALALHLDQLGLRVFAGVLEMGGPGETQLVKAATDRLTTIQMDVTDEKQVLTAAQTVTEMLDGSELHGVVNNAGLLFLGSIEVMSLADIKKQLMVNYMGQVLVNRAFLPLLRHRRCGLARLVNVASNVGLAPAAGFGAYGASKAASAILSDTLRFELKPLGIGVSTIIPSGYKTGIMMYNREAAANRWWKEASNEVKQFYGRDSFIPQDKIKKSVVNPDFSSIVQSMTDALLSIDPKPIYFKGLLARSLPFAYFHSPYWLWDKLMPYLAEYHRFPIEALKKSADIGDKKFSE